MPIDFTKNPYGLKAIRHKGTNRVTIVESGAISGKKQKARGITDPEAFLKQYPDLPEMSDIEISRLAGGTAGGNISTSQFGGGFLSDYESAYQLQLKKAGRVPETVAPTPQGLATPFETAFKEAKAGGMPAEEIKQQFAAEQKAARPELYPAPAPTPKPTLIPGATLATISEPVLGKTIEGFPKNQAEMAEWRKKYIFDKATNKWYEKPAGVTKGDTVANLQTKIADTTAKIQNLQDTKRKKEIQNEIKILQKTLDNAKALGLGDTDQIPDSIIPKDLPDVPAIDIPGVVPTDQLDGAGGTLDLPDPEATANFTSYVSGISADLENKKKAVDDFYTKQLKSVQDEKTAVEKKISDIEAKQKTMLKEDVKPLLDPFRADLEAAERKRLKIEENFFANQNSVKELETLLTSAMAEIQQAEGVTGLTAIRTPRIAKLKEDLAARVGIIEAVMAARNNQITVAENMIDRSISAIESDRKDQLTYYQALLDFDEAKKGKEEAKLVNLTADEKAVINAQIGRLEGEMEDAQVSVDYIKGLMLDPATADIVERSGVTLTDSIEEIQKKFSDDGYKQEIIETGNALEEDGYQLLGTVHNKPEEEIVRIVDSRGKERAYWKPKEVVTGGGADGFVTVGQHLGLDKSTAAKFDTDWEQEIRNVYGGKYGTEGARETALRNLQAKYPGVSDKINDLVYGLGEYKENAPFPDGYESQIEGGTGQQFINPDYIKEQIGSRLNVAKVRQAAGVAKWNVLKDKEYENLINNIMKGVEEWRVAGYNDDEIWDKTLKELIEWEK